MFERFDSNLFVNIQAPSFQEAQLTFINPTNTPQTIRPSEYFLESQNKNVQDLAVFFSNQLESEFEAWLADEIMRILNYFSEHYPSHYPLTEKEKNLINSDPLEALEVLQMARLANRLTEKHFPEGGEDDEGDPIVISHGQPS